MSRADLYGSGCTLIVGGIAYFIGGPLAAIGALSVGALLIILAHMRKSEEDPEPLISNGLREVYPPVTAPINKNEQQEQTGKRERDFSGKWEQLASQFRGIPSSVMAMWQHGGLGFKAEGQLLEQWTIRGEGYQDCMPLCKKAGSMLLLSPKILEKLSEKARSEPDPVDRWLYFLQENHRAVKIDTNPGVFVDDDGRRQIIVMGDINTLGAVSARACRDCSAEEL